MSPARDRKCLVVIMLLLGIGMVPGQQETEANKKQNNEKPVVVSAVHTELEVRAAPPVIEGIHVDESGVAVSRVSRAQLEDLQAYDLLTGLRQVPGILISRYNLVGSYGGADGGTLYIRGLGSGRPGGEIQFLVDGIPKFVGVWTHPLMDVLGLDQVESIDVIKGASPVLYGNMSFGAVHVRTRSMREEGRILEMSVTGGGHDTLLGSFNAGFRQGRFDAWVSAGYRRSDGHRPHSAGELQNFFGRVAHEIAPGWRMSLRLTHTNNYAQDPGTVTEGPPRRGQFNTEDLTVLVALENERPGRAGYLRFYLDDGGINWQQWDTAREVPWDTDTDYRNWGLRGRQDWSANDHLRLVMGVDWDHYGGRVTQVRDGRTDSSRQTGFWNTAPYAMLEGDWGERTRFLPSVGVRFNVNRHFGNFLAPQAGFRLRRGVTEWHASVGRGFNLPGVYAAMLYADWHAGDTWQDLRPEKNWHLETGISHLLASMAQVSLTFFHDRITDGLRFSAPPPHFENVGAGTIDGVEATLSVFPLDSLQLFAATTWLHSRPDNLPYAPQHTLSFGGNYRIHRRLTLSLDGQAVGARWTGNPRYNSIGPRLERYFLLNSRLRLDVAPADRPGMVELFLSLENATDTTYEYRAGYPMPGRTLFGGVRIRVGSGE